MIANKNNLYRKVRTPDLFDISQLNRIPEDSTPNLTRFHNNEVFVKHQRHQNHSFERFPRSLRPSVTTKQPENPVFRKTAVFLCSDQIRPIPVAESGQKLQKAHLQAKTFHMSLFPRLYDHPLQRYSLEKNRWQTDGRTHRIYRPPTFECSNQIVTGRIQYFK